MSRNVHEYLICIPYTYIWDKSTCMHGAVLQTGWVIRIIQAVEVTFLGHMGQPDQTYSYPVCKIEI